MIISNNIIYMMRLMSRIRKELFFREKISFIFILNIIDFELFLRVSCLIVGLLFLCKLRLSYFVVLLNVFFIVLFIVVLSCVY